MTTTIFKKVDYELAGLINDIDLGRIGLPDIQRPFIWKNPKVRDLFDSMYKGYPVGYLLLWENGATEGSRNIGTDSKQVPPDLLIVDGQQRLTSLYAIVKGKPVIRANYSTENIRIAFNPLTEEFAVTDAAIQRDKSYIPDISIFWHPQTGIIRLAKDYIEKLKADREVSDEEEEKIQNSIESLRGLSSYPFTALQLAANISEEDVADVFVRVNSLGVPLNQANFILTLMSVFWDEGRTQLEEFCRQSRTPSESSPSPFNHFIEPDPDQLLRVCVGLAFKRARLEYIYSILRGKDLETQQFSSERREAQFEVLRQAQERVLNIQYWHDFMRCIHQAGFRSKDMITSSNGLLFSYIFYLIGRTEFKVNEFELRKTISQWFFMSAMTGRYTSSPESTLESDLALIRGASDASQFVGRLRNVCNRELTNDFWEITLPNNLATSAASSPSRYAYEAAQVVLEAPGLFSNTKISDLLDPTLQSNKSAIERHHLFPRGYLSKSGIGETRDTNQIANYAYVEWGDNVRISDQSPSDYLPPLRERFTQQDWSAMHHFHALPQSWEQMDYRAFLERRQELMAQIAREGYEKLCGTANAEPILEELDVSELIASGESDSVEFKSTLRRNLHTGKSDPRIEHSALKTLAGFLNTNGGKLIIGVSDDGTPVGTETDNFQSEDQMSLHLTNIGISRLGFQAMTSVHAHFDDYEDSRVMVLDCQRSSTPVYLRDGSDESFFIRIGPATRELTVSEVQAYNKQRFN
ncbi:MAG: DUF262 domain-containing protein [Chloroflexi bacterium]|nr:DUF262 domain-containing protein [Chloroflexota bacterium]